MSIQVVATFFISALIVLQTLQARLPQAGYHGITDPAFLNTLESPVQEVWMASQKYPNFKEAVTDEDIEKLYSDSLELDFRPWKERNLTMNSFDQLLRQLVQNDVMRVVLIKGNKVYYPLQSISHEFQKSESTRCAQPCNMLLEHWHDSMDSFLREATFPDVIFFLNVNDWPKCRIGSANPHHRRPGPCISGCLAPVLSFQKSKEFEDILIPILSDMKHPLYIFPWEQKVDKAFFRATAFCAQPDSHQHYAQCARTYLTRLAMYHNKSDVLEVGLTTGFGAAVSGNEGETDPDAVADGALPAVGFVPFRDSARYKYLLDTDGMTASYRASKLMHINSPIFKQVTPWFEYWGRSVKPYEHHIPFWVTDKDDLFDILEKHRHNETYLKEVAMNAMQFAYRYTSEKARLLYMVKVLQEYKKLFPDMDEYIAKLKL